MRANTNEIPLLLRRLGSRRRRCADEARTRLSIIGAPAVDDLIDALEGADNRVRARVMPLLALIRDPRARVPLIAMLLDRSAALRAVAARSLGRFAAPDSVAALTRVLEKDRSAEVREAAARALAELFAAGQEPALAPLLVVLGDTGEAPRTRLAASPVVTLVPPAERRALLARLRRDPDAEVRRRAEAMATLDPPGPDPETAIVERSIAALGSEDYTVWNEAVERLGACGASAIAPLLAEMERRAGDTEFCTRGGMALKALGPRRGRTLADALAWLVEPLPLQIVVETIGSYGDKSLIYRLRELIERMAARELAACPERIEAAARVRAKAHLELARVGSRVAIADLHAALADPTRPIDPEILLAVHRIGKRDELGVLLEAYGRERGAPKRQIAEVVRTILRRERIRRNNRMFQALAAQQLVALHEILPARTSRRFGATADPVV